MENVSPDIADLFKTFQNLIPERIEMLPPSGSDRIYFRIYSNHKTFIATYNQNIKENKVFIYFSRHFKMLGLPVPEIYSTNDEQTIYIQEDLGTESLLNQLEKFGPIDEVYNLFCKSLSALAKIQIRGDKSMNYEKCLTAKEFGKQAIMSDLLYFKYYFLDTLGFAYDKQAILDDFETLSSYLTISDFKFFMYRDFQSRNIIINEGNVSFIDYQGGMKGALQYDVASLLWQAKADLSEEWKNNLLTHYLDEVDQLLNTKIDRVTFISQYNGYVLIRLLQVMGAYGFRGLFERKAHFLSSIPLALRNLKFFLENKSVAVETPEFDRILKRMTKDDIIEHFTAPQADENTALQVEINSFSYRVGIPQGDSENGGGFVFDMRGILNPGRFDEYKYLCGNDKTVMDFLEQRTRMSEFLNSAWDMIDISVEEYLSRGFNNLLINFGCTGGQHRSVYAADQTARHLRNKYNVKIVLNHLNEDNWKKDTLIDNKLISPAS